MSTLAAVIAASGSGGTAPPVTPPTPIVWNNTVNVAIDGNSIYANWIYGGIETVGNFGALKTASGASTGNVAVPGQTWTNMMQNPADIDALYRDDKATNVLVAIETTNAIALGATVAATKTVVTQYVAQRRLTHPWDAILLGGSIPRGGTAGDATINSRLVEVDDWMAANYEDIGATAYVGFRDISYFSYSGNAQEGFMSSTATCNESSAPFVHPIGAARTALANRLAEKLQTLTV